MSSVDASGATRDGDAAPTPDGFVAPPLHEWKAAALLRGVGAPVAKSEAFTSASVQPPSARRAAVVLLGAGAAPLPSKQFAVPLNPMKSTTPAPNGQPEPASCVVVDT